MNTYALIPLIAAIAYIPLLVILLNSRPWQRRHRLLLLYLVPAILWSVSDIFFRSDFWMSDSDKTLILKVVLCIMAWTIIQFHYFLCSFYHFQRIKIPFAYAFPIAAVVLALLGKIPQVVNTDVTPINIDYGIWVIVIVLFFLFTVGARDVYSLVRRLKISPEPAERNQITYLLSAIAILAVFILASIAPRGGEYPVAHIGNFLTACILTYAVVAHRLLDVRVVFRRGLIYLGLYGTGIAAWALLLFLISLIPDINLDFATLAVASAIGVPIILFFVHKVREPWKTKLEQSFTRETYKYRRQLADFTSKIHNIPTLEQFGSGLISLLSKSVGCQISCLLLPQTESRYFTARFIYPPVENNPTRNLILSKDSPVVSWLERESRLLPKRNLGLFPEFQGMWQKEREEIQSAKVEMFVPLINRGELVAILAVGKKQDSQLYTVEDMDLLESVANRVAASMEKEYFHEQLAEQDKELTLINHLTTIITSSVNIREIFEGFIRELKEFIDVDWATVALAEGDQLYFLALSSTTGSAWQTGERIPLKGTATEWVCREKKSLYEANLARHRIFWTGDYHLRHGVHSIVYLPLVIKDKSIGSLILASRRPDAYRPEHIRILEHLALQIAMPIENSQLYAKAEQRSRIDELTGLFNRRHFEERLKEEMARHSRYSGVFSLFLVDLDDFKLYNDIYGHLSGDELLREIGGIVRSSIRSADQAFRYGGDEFIVILPQTTMNDAYTVAERVRVQIAAEMEAKQITVTCSIGMASYPSDGVMSGELVTVADTALYYAKRTGGNRVYLSSKILSEPAPGAGISARDSGLSAVYALATAVEARDPCTYGHSKKVNAYAVALAEAVGLSPDEVSKVSTAALLHDIGKIGIRDGILDKKGKLNDEDWQVIKSHPRLGANIVGNVPSLVPCLGSILYHHEMWDGTGYPEGLKGENIPLEARILAIADAFAAMTSVRPYRRALPPEKAMEELKRGAGRQFDPKLVEAFLSIIQAGFPEKVKVMGDLASEQPGS